MKYHKSYTDKGQVTNFSLIGKKRVPKLDDFKKVIFEMISTHPLTDGRISFQKTYEIANNISEEKEHYVFDIKGQDLKVFWG